MKKYNLDPSLTKLNLDTFQQWQLEFFGNPANKDAHLGTTFIETFYPLQQGSFWQDLSMARQQQAVIMICDYLIDYTDLHAQAVASVMDGFSKGDPEETEGVIVNKPKPH